MANLIGFIARRAARRLARKLPLKDAAGQAAQTLVREGKWVVRQDDRARAAGTSLRRMFEKLRDAD